MEEKKDIKKILNSFPKRLGLNKLRISRLLKKLGNPHENLPPVIHVAGTNGKGSTIAYIKAGLESRGDKVHVFTSPHLIEITERILIAGDKIKKKYFNFLIDKCIVANKGNDLSFFELLTAVAFLAFAQNKADWTILEVGLGGRLDSTNVINNPVMSIITPISMDHQEFLGNSIEKIALEKCGIIKNNSNLIISKQHNSALDIIKKISEKSNCKTSIYETDFKAKKINNSFIFYSKRKKIILPLPLLAGSHQIENAAVSIEALIKLKCRRKNLIDALMKVNWPGRLQKIKAGTFSSKDLGTNGELFIDGGHNVAASVSLSKWMKNLDDCELYLIIGMMNNKDLEGFLKPIKPFINKLFAIGIPFQENSYDPNEIVRKSKKLGINSQVGENLENTLELLISEKKSKSKKILITGSLYLVGYFLEKNG